MGMKDTKAYAWNLKRPPLEKEQHLQLHHFCAGSNVYFSWVYISNKMNASVTLLIIYMFQTSIPEQFLACTNCQFSEIFWYLRSCFVKDPEGIELLGPLKMLLSLMPVWICPCLWGHIFLDLQFPTPIGVGWLFEKRQHKANHFHWPTGLVLRKWPANMFNKNLNYFAYPPSAWKWKTYETHPQIFPEFFPTTH